MFNVGIGKRFSLIGVVVFTATILWFHYTSPSNAQIARIIAIHNQVQR